jgi:hypothetical protein
VKWANNVAACAAFLLGLKRSTTLQHDRLAVPANVGDQFNAALGPNQGTATGLLGQGMVVPDFGDRQLMAHVLGALLKNGFQLALKQRVIKVA